MARVATQDLEGEIVAVLNRADQGKYGAIVSFMTAYQVLKELPPQLQQELEREYGPSGKKAGTPFSAASRVAQVLEGIAGIEIDYLDTAHMTFDTGSTDAPAGYKCCGLYRLPEGHPRRQP